MRQKHYNKINSNMNTERNSPIDKLNDFSQEDNEYYNVDFTSGKKLKGVDQDTFSAMRKEINVRGNFAPFVVLAQPPSQQPLNPSIKTNTAIEVESQKLDMIINEKQYDFNQMIQQNAKEKQKINQAMAKLQELKFQRYQKVRKLIELKKANLKVNRDLDVLNEKTQNKVQYMRDFIKKQEQAMYQTNRQIFRSQKEQESIKEDIVKTGAKIEQIISITLSKEKYLQSLKEQQASLDKSIQQKKHCVQQNKKCLYQQALQVSVLKMQINPNLRVGFEAIIGEKSAKKKILEKNPNIWQKKNKILTMQEMKHYVLMQLYPSWRKILDRISYQFVGYKQLLFQNDLLEEQILKNLDEYVFTNLMKKTISKSKAYIVIYSPLPQTYTDTIENLLLLNGLDNGIIRIHNIAVEMKEAEQLVIYYDFKGENRTKVFEIVRLKELSKQTLSGFIPKAGDKTVLMKIQIPFCFESLGDRLKMQQLYRLIQRQR